MKKNINKQSGFTLIEVVLVLAIGALIILLALTAFGGAQRSRRDTSRTDAVGRVASLVEQYAANGDGSYPTDTSGLQSVTGNIVEPLSGSKPVYGAGDVTSSNVIQFATGQKCNTNGTTVAVASAARTYAISYMQENGKKLACKDNVN